MVGLKKWVTGAVASCSVFTGCFTFTTETVEIHLRSSGDVVHTLKHACTHVFDTCCISCYTAFSLFESEGPRRGQQAGPLYMATNKPLCGAVHLRVFFLAFSLQEKPAHAGCHLQK